MADLRVPNLNRYECAARLTRDPELRYTPDGKAVCEIGIAVNERIGQKDHTYFARCEAWEKTAEYICSYLHKGDAVLIEGKMRNVKDKEDKVHTRIVIRSIQPLQWEDKDGTRPTSKRQEPEVDDEEVPF